MKFIAVIQARMSSSRLPGKVLADIGHGTILEYLIKRLESSSLLDQIILATTDYKVDKPIVACGKKNNISVVTGPENDVLERFMKVLSIHEADSIIRITADNPITDPFIIDEMETYRRNNQFDYVKVKNCVGGISGDIFTYKTLEKCSKESKTSYQREHINAYVLDNPELFEIGEYEPDINLRRPDLTLTVDTSEELKYMQNLLSTLPKNSFHSISDVMKLVIEGAPECPKFYSD